MSSKSKAKGNANERAVAKKLTDWWGSAFLRTPNSGAMRRKGLAWEYGDLNVPDDFPGIIEAKFYKEIEVDLLLKGDSSHSIIYQWWNDQLLPDVRRCFAETGERVEPLLIFKENNRHHLLALDDHFFNKLRIYPPVFYFKCNIGIDTSFAIVSLDNFLKNITKEVFLEACKEDDFGT